MNVLLRDIKNFLKKLETGQMEIEAGQWELHKDITNLRKTVDEVKKIKDDVMEMKMCSTEQTGLIKKLECKLESFRNKNYKEMECKNMEYDDAQERQRNLKRTSDWSLYQDHEKRKVASSENFHSSGKVWDNKRNEDSITSGEINSLEESEDSLERDQKLHNCPKSSRKKLHNRKFNFSGILERYLRDAAKYCEKRNQPAKPVSKKFRPSSYCTSEPEIDHQNHKRNFKIRNSSSIKGMKTRKPCKHLDLTESILPKNVFCPKNSKKLTYNTPSSDREKVNRVKPNNFCLKSLKNKTSWKSLDLHEDHNKPSTAYKCAYCNKMCKSAKSLTMHMRKCRIILRPKCNK